MAFIRPKLAELVERTNADIASRMTGGRSAVLRRSVLGVLSRALAGLSHLLHGHLDYNARQLLPDSADAEHLERWASIWGIKRTAATFASGAVTFTGISGSVVPAGTVLQRDDGAEYVTDAEGTLSSGSASVSVTARAAGRDGNLDPAITLSLLSPIAGVDSSATVGTAGITGGADQENDERLRERTMARIQNPPHGGADFDYEQWALAVADVTRVWVYPQNQGGGTVGIAFVCDDLSPIIPDAAKVQTVQDAIDAQRPVTADATVFAPTAAALDFTISGLTPSTAAVKAAIEAELGDLIKREAEPGGTILISHIREAISVAAGEHDHTLTAPTADVTHAVSSMAVMGTITWA